VPAVRNPPYGTTAPDADSKVTAGPKIVQICDEAESTPMITASMPSVVLKTVAVG
jgi:hypothetical protein